MSNKKTLYIVVAVLVILNIVTLSIFWSRRLFNPFSMMGGRWSGGMGGHGSVRHDHSTGEFNTWEEMRKHMEEEHGKESLIIGDTSTSTTVELDNIQLGLNEEAELAVYFDPNFHKESLDKITHSVFVETDDSDLSEVKFDIFVELVD